MRFPLLIANWKMHKTCAETKSFVDELLQHNPRIVDREVVVCPPFTALAEASKGLKPPIQLGAQNVFWENQGAFTGEISPAMLKEIGCTYVLIAHSERRQYFGETNQTANRKVLATLAHGLRPILCIGETLKEKEKGQTNAVLLTQIHEGLKNVTAKNSGPLVIAYEPVWAIGTGKSDSPAQSNATILFIRNAIQEIIGKHRAEQIRILYGGSVNPENIGRFMAQPEIDGALVGGASLNPESFARIIAYDQH